mgnify:CR=1 FL=1
MLAYLILILSVYGWSWIITKSKITESFRQLLKTRALLLKKYDKPWKVYWYNKLFKTIDYIFNCIVCTSVWMSLFIIVLLKFFPESKMTSFFTNTLDTILIIGSIVSSSWIISKFTGDSE